MPDTVEVARLFNPEEALEVCHKLDSEGVDVIYDPPAATGNYIFDWNVSSPQFVVSVPDDQVEKAHQILHGTEVERTATEEEAGESYSVDELNKESDESDEDEIVEDAREIRMALHFSVLAWLIPPFVPFWLPIATPFAVKRVMDVEPLAVTPRDHRRLGYALAISVSSTVWLLGGLLAYWMGGFNWWY